MDDFYTFYFEGKPRAIESPINITDPNEVILIHEGDLDLHLDKTIITLTGKVIFRWFPEISVHIDAKTSNKNFKLLNSTTSETGLQLYIDGLKFSDIDQFTCSIGSGESFIKISAYSSGTVILKDRSTPVEKITFSVPNLKELFSEEVVSSKEKNLRLVAGRLSFPTQDFEIVIDRLYDYKEYHESLTNMGGYTLLYSGELKSTFGGIQFEEAKNALDCFSKFLSLLNGRRTAPLFRHGIYESEVKWVDFTNYPVDIYKKVDSWAPDKALLDLKDIWKRFYELWKDNDCKEFLTLAIHWYVEANSGESFPEGAIIKAQTALELIYNWLIVERLKLIHGHDAEKISAANKIRLLLSQLKVSSKIPNSLSSLQTILDNLTPDGPEAFVKIRNSIVHSQSKKRNELKTMHKNVKSDALKLSIWYIELSLLYILGYNGQYMNRAALNAVPLEALETVPWV